MNGSAGIRRVLPWALCAVSLALLVAANWVLWLRDDSRGGSVEWLEWTIEALGFAGIPVVGALMASRLPANPYGWVWCAAGLAFATSMATEPIAQALDGPPSVGWLLEGWGFVSFIGSLIFVFLLFPTGRLPTERWRWPARAAVAGTVLLALAVPFMTDPDDPSQRGPWALPGGAGVLVFHAATVVLYGMFGLALVAMASLVVRFRRAGGVERRQLTWFLYATVVNGVLVVFDVVLGVLPSNPATTALSAVGFAMLPVAVGVAVLRYRLYEIDRIVSRTVSWGVLTAGVLVAYLGLVAVLRPLLEPFTGSSALAVAGSTLAVAAAFNPARRRLQEAVDRRFDRARYDAARAVDAFTSRLRNQVDLDEVTTGLRDTVVTTVAPTHVAVWLRPPSGTGRV